MAGYLVTAPSGIDIPNSDGTIGSGDGTFTHYAAGSYVPLAKLLPDQYRWYVQQGLISETENMTASPTFTGTVNLPSADATKNVTFSSGYATLGLVTIGRSGTGYGTIGDGYQTTSTANTYKYDRNDYATQIDFASGGIKLKTAASGTAGNTVTFTDRLSITNGGITTLPTQPSFSAYRYDAAGTITFTASTDIPFNTTNHNVGSHFSTSTGRFTAPVAGKYLFSAHFFKYTTYDNNTNTYWGFFVNGARTTTINHGVEGQDGGQSHSAIISLNANDYVSVQHNDSLSTYSGVYNNFSGHLLG